MTAPAAAQAHALGRLAAWAFDGAVDGVQRVHRGIARRAVPRAARRAHDAVAGTTYAAVRGVGAGVLVAAGSLGTVAARRGATALADTAAGGAGLAVLAGVIGDRLAEPLASPMTWYPDGRPATGRIVVFAHGLIETERWWRPRDGGPDYGAQLADGLGWSAVRLRYNTGRHVSENGAALDGLLDELVAEWPVPVTEIALVGHSMGGLVARSAARQASDRGAPWVCALRHVVCLGSPHRGSPLERAANVAGWALRAAPETRPFAEFLELRSAGIKDLRYGYLTASDWAGHQADALLDDRRGDCADLPGVGYHFVASCLDGPAGWLGDVLVREASAFDARTSGSLTRLPGVRHLDLLHHPQVYVLLRDWLT